MGVENRASARRAWKLQEVTTAAMGCKAALEPVTSTVSGVPRQPGLLPAPGSSRTSEASPGPRLQELNFLDSSAQVSQSIRRQHPALDLVALDGFEQRLEVAFAKAIVAFALDELEKHWPHQGGGEYLQQQPTLAAFG
ncbi:hypothetical protein PSTA9_02186 [Pseudomonas syringae pv. tomato]|uniref:Uncharacterized protein n=1 Tax=Pseudomonas syringae pv. tomato TaxID=323 RepID=A0AAV1BKX0_PSEUB|nr:hypothetical protein PSTA9_02186 [Pseudomonas syringae pv. tomato]CAI8831627.1 hypothetical protein DAPPPG215_10880 [Pseudomonas syringae pv. tomato]